MASTHYLRQGGAEWFMNNASATNVVFYDATKLGQPRPAVQHSLSSKKKKQIAEFIPEFDKVWRQVRGESFQDTLRRMMRD